MLVYATDVYSYLTWVILLGGVSSTFLLSEDNTDVDDDDDMIEPGDELLGFCLCSPDLIPCYRHGVKG